MYHITAAEIMDEVALEALVRIPKPCVPKLRAAEQCETLTVKMAPYQGRETRFKCLKEEKE